jgi:hypothetical protein
MEMVVAYFEAVSYLPGGIKKNNEKTSSHHIVLNGRTLVNNKLEKFEESSRGLL